MLKYRMPSRHALAALALLALSPAPAAAQAKVGFVSFQGHALTGFTPSVDVEEGVKAFVEWYRAEIMQ